MKTKNKKHKKTNNLKLFCLACGLELAKANDVEWHKDVGHKLIPASQVTIKDKEKDQRTPSKKAFDLAMTKVVKLVINENNTDEVYAVVNVNNHVESLDLSSARACYWLNDLYSKNIDSNEIHSEDFYKTVLNSMISYAQMNETERTKVHIRIAQLEDEIWYDLGTPDWKALRITKEGVQTVKLDSNSPIFSRTQSLQTQIVPKDSDDDVLDKLVELLRIEKRDSLVFKVNLVALFLEAIPVPIMVFDGSAGSIKTTVTATIKAIVDPSGKTKEDNVATMAEKPDDLINQLSNRCLSAFDNVSIVDLKTSDILCRAITGSSNPKRKLYTNQEESIRSYRRKVVLNGIVPTLEYPDLQTRILKYARQLIDETNRITEKDFNERLNALLPDILGQIFITICKALRQYSDLEKSIKPKTRMSDFEVWGETISRVLGYNENEFLNAYYSKLKEENISSQDAYPIVATIQEFMKQKNYYEDTTSAIYKELKTIAEDLGIDIRARYVRFPRASNKLPRELKIVEPLLRANGLIVESYHYTKNDGMFTKNASIVKITKKNNQASLNNEKVSSPSSPIQIYEQNQAKIGEGTGEDPQGRNNVSSPEEDKITHENRAGEDGEGSEGSFLISPDSDIMESQKPYYICYTCNEKGTEVRPLSYIGPNGLSVDTCKKACHNIKFLTEKEAKIERDYQMYGGLRP